MAYDYGSHRPGLKGTHPGSPTGPHPHGSGPYHAGLHYLKTMDIEDQNRVKGAHLESAESPKAVDRASGRPSSGRPTPQTPVGKAYKRGGEVN